MSDYCHSELGVALARELHPLTDLNEINQRLQFSAECISWLPHHHEINLENLRNLRPLFEERQQQVFAFEELQQIAENCRLTGILKAWETELGDYPNLEKRIKRLIPFAWVVERFEQVFSPEGEILDTASPTLAAIRRKQRGMRDQIIKTLSDKFQDARFEKFLQEKIITQRDDRYVIPIKESTIAFVPGIVKGRSSSKASVYIEPQEVVGLNNELILLQEKEKAEIFRILSQFTNDILPLEDSLLRNTAVMQELDFYFAVARLGQILQARVPELSEEPILKLYRARHPLLIMQLRDIRKVIPFDLELGNETSLLVLSGPNTGGKTVTLKSVGLLAMMALSGLPIPVSDGTVIGKFSYFFADIGDEQSLESALSTFSSHISRIKGMLHQADQHSLILIDEIGAATDPEQGSALAQAIIEKLVEKQVRGVVTTHYMALKLFAEQTVGCMNAAMQFDASKHAPTYQFVPGLPGDSFAIEVAASLGLEEELIDRARSLAGQQQVEMTHIIGKMQEQKKELAKLTYQHKLQTRLLEQKVKEYEESLSKQDQVMKETRKKGIVDARDFLTLMQKQLYDELGEIRKLDREERKQKMEEALQKIQMQQQELGEEVKKLSPAKNLGQQFILEVGATVWLEDFDTSAQIVDMNGKDITVDMNGIRFQTTAERVKPFKQKQKEATTSGKTVRTQSMSAKFELKLLGLTFDEARPRIDEFIDEAISASLNKLRIVHGKGTGVLRSKVRQYLQRHKHVKGLQTPPPEAGGDGVTIIELR